MSASALERALAGDGQAFAELTACYRRELHLHCYRMLGSVADADDLLQETMIAAWRGLGGFADRSSLRAWLYRIATNCCLNAARDARRRPPPVPVPPFEPPEPSRRGDVTWLQPYPDAWLDTGPGLVPGPSARYQARETARLAFIAALQRIPPRQTAAVVLCDVLGFSLTEVAAMLEVTPVAVKGLIQRARASLRRQQPAGADAAPEPGSAAEAELAQRFADAYSTDDVDAVVALLTDDAWLAMPPAPHEYHGADAITAFLRASAKGRAGRHLGLVPTRANTHPAFACYLGKPGDPDAEPSGLVILTLSADRITTVTRFLDARLPALFGSAIRVAIPGPPVPPARTVARHTASSAAEAAPVRVGCRVSLKVEGCGHGRGCGCLTEGGRAEQSHLNICSACKQPFGSRIQQKFIPSPATSLSSAGLAFPCG